MHACRHDVSYFLNFRNKQARSMLEERKCPFFQNIEIISIQGPLTTVIPLHVPPYSLA